MKRLLISVTFSVLSATVFADSLEPACRGESVRAELLGTYRSLGAGVWWDKMELTANFVKLYWNPSERNDHESHRVWTCSVQKDNFLVFDYQNETYESILVGESPEGFIEYGEVFGPEFTDAEVARLKRDRSDHVIHRRF